MIYTVDTLIPERYWNVLINYLALKQPKKKPCHQPRNQHQRQHLPLEAQLWMQIRRMMHWTAVFMLVSWIVAFQVISEMLVFAAVSSLSLFAVCVFSSECAGLRATLFACHIFIHVYADAGQENSFLRTSKKNLPDIFL